MARKRQSLAEIAREDGQLDQSQTLGLVPKPEESPEVKIRKPISEIRNSKSDFVKLSVTVPPEMFEALQKLSMSRRQAKQPYMMSDLIREAVRSWLPES
jgi:hypothetical protein